MRVVVALSGGLDSSLLCYLLKKQNHTILPVHVDYGQLAEAREWASCLQVCEHIGITTPVRMDFSGMRCIPSGLTNRDSDIAKEAFLPTRNLLILTACAAYAYPNSVNVIAAGILANPIFPDQTPSFISSVESCLSEALGVKTKILAPLISFDKREILRLARKEKFPVELCYYCHSGSEEPCGKCISCSERTKAEQMLEGIP